MRYFALTLFFASLPWSNCTIHAGHYCSRPIKDTIESPITTFNPLMLHNELQLISKKYNILYDVRDSLQDKVTLLELAKNTLRNDCSHRTLKSLRIWLAGIKFIVKDKTNQLETLDDSCWQATKQEVTEQLQYHQPILDKYDKLLESYYAWKKALIGQENLIPLTTFLKESITTISHTEAQELLHKLQSCPLQEIQLGDDSDDSDDSATA